MTTIAIRDHSHNFTGGWTVLGIIPSSGNLLLSKCTHISRALGINKFDLILMHDKSFKEYLEKNKSLWC